MRSSCNHVGTKCFDSINRCPLNILSIYNLVLWQFVDNILIVRIRLLGIFITKLHTEGQTRPV